MKIYDETGALLESPDLEKGYLTDERRVAAHHEGVAAQAEQYHLEVMAGTQGLRRKVVDRPAQPAAPAWDEYETVQVYHPYTAEELAELARPTLEQRVSAVEGAVLELLLGGEAGV